VLNLIKYFLSNLILVMCNDFTHAYFKPLPQLSRSQLPPYIIGRYSLVVLAFDNGGKLGDNSLSN
jgi:hypothetical protein